MRRLSPWNYFGNGLRPKVRPLRHQNGIEASLPNVWLQSSAEKNPFLIGLTPKSGLRIVSDENQDLR
jgi:hypothetical protein